MTVRLRAAARLAWPPSRRWRRFLSSLPLDPDRLPRPLESPGPNDVIICGSPRTGTSLLAAALYQPPAMVVAMEPWDGMRLPPSELFASLRTEIARTGRLTRQRLDVPALLGEGAVRWCREGEQVSDVITDEDYVLAVKWPAFWQYLELLPDTRFIVCLRHPYEVIVSYRKAGGRLEQGLNYDTAFNSKMNDELRRATSNLELRRVLLFDYIHSRILPHLDRPNVLSVRYEHWFSDSERVVQDIAGFLDVPLGAPRPLIRAPRSVNVDDAERDFIRSHCTTAHAIGYALH